MNTQITITNPADRAAIELVTNALTSEHSKRAYARALVDFLAWRGDRNVTKALVNEYRQTLTGSAARVNLIMSAIRKLASEAADNGYMDAAIANGVKNVKGVAAHGVRAGNWLTKHEAQRLLTSMDLQDAKGLAITKAYRDRAILAVMIGGGLRRSEVARLMFEHIQQRDGRWVIVDMMGKGNHVRSVPIPSWVKLAIDEWATLAGISSGLVFREIHKSGDVLAEREAYTVKPTRREHGQDIPNKRAGQVMHKGGGISPQAVRDIVKLYGAKIAKPELAAHDLRRTYAKLAHKGGAGVDQIQLSLGHLSLKTTEKYLGVQLNLTDAPGDHLGLTLGE